jgi:hypothetical protein
MIWYLLAPSLRAPVTSAGEALRFFAGRGIHSRSLKWIASVAIKPAPSQ